jgi:hypothetical protein
LAEHLFTVERRNLVIVEASVICWP